MSKIFFVSINPLLSTFSRIEPGKDFDFILETSEENLYDSQINIGDFILVSSANDIFYHLEVHEKLDKELRLTKIFEVHKSIKIDLGEEGKIVKLDVIKFNEICKKIFNDYVVNDFSEQEFGVNIIEAFIDWFILKDGIKHNYFKDAFSSNREKLKKELLTYEEIYSKEFHSELFRIKLNNIENLISTIKENLEKREGDFFKYSEGKSTHMPRAIIGKNNYLAFLKEILDKEVVVEKAGFDYLQFNKSCQDSGLKFDLQLISRYCASLLTKPFVILTGLSGSGKTKLAQAFAEWICENSTQYRLVPVGADWTNREPLLGFPNALENEKYVKPDNRVLDLIIEAGKNADKPYFLILDEMNLSHVERYFADFLSTMESKGEIFLHEGTKDWNGVPPSVRLPKNLFIIGTVNIDETTYMFSPKVLDRANTIEFRITEEEMGEFLKNPGDVDLMKLNGKGAGFGSSFIKLATGSLDKNNKLLEINSVLSNFFVQLKIAGAEFGYRTASEIQRFAQVVQVMSPDTKIEDIIDFAILQKLLPKLHGSRRKLEPVFEELIKLCLKDGAETKEFKTGKAQVDTSDKTIVKYPLSLEKIVRMYNNLIHNGFTSFAEA